MYEPRKIERKIYLEGPTTAHFSGMLLTDECRVKEVFLKRAGVFAASWNVALRKAIKGFVGDIYLMVPRLTPQVTNNRNGVSEEISDKLFW
jgi:hypothetical protein